MRLEMEAFSKKLRTYLTGNSIAAVTQRQFYSLFRQEFIKFIAYEMEKFWNLSYIFVILLTSLYSL